MSMLAELRSYVINPPTKEETKTSTGLTRCQNTSGQRAEGGGPLAWRVFIGLEGSALLLAALGLVVHAARPRAATRTEKPRGEARRAPRVLISNDTTDKGRSVAQKLLSSGCRVSSLAAAREAGDKADALVVFGAQPTRRGLDGLATVVSNDVFANMTVMEKARDYVRPGGCLVWVSGGTISGSFEASAAAFEDVLRTQLQLIADNANCEAVWVDRGDPTSQARDILTVILSSMTHNTPQQNSFRSPIRLTLVLWRWLKRFTWHMES
ncbi:hypothetical protein EVAR_98086_1 [Eumeta japonica]|uniref:Uncharacterized protein n=1 Tax=Eumeta variegata TaxID=151549 RepID=A0A4C1WEK3_EUMVA|nr:hypothetical protein EVAR_98086_1 [Eumeta japonica]